MKVIKRINYSLPHERVRELTSILRRYFIAQEAKVDTMGMRTSVQISMDAADERYNSLLSAIEDLGVDTPIIQARLQCQSSELDGLPWLHMRLGVAGIGGGIDYEQKYDYTDACAACGAGASPIPPLVAQLSDMRDNQIAATWKEQFIVVPRALGELLENASLSGFRLQEVRNRRPMKGDDRWRWLEIPSEMPPMTLDGQVDASDLCPECDRAGYEWIPGETARLFYSNLSLERPDFNMTREYFGEWSPRRPKDINTAPGYRAIVVSQAVRRLFSAMNYRQIEFEPIWRSSELTDVLT